MAAADRVDRFDLKGRSLRAHTARGVLINAAFQIGLSTLGVSRRFFIAIFLTAADYGLWGLIYTAVATILWLKDVGIGDKFIQQDEDDQEAAFQKAFSLDLVWSGIFVVLIAVAMPVFALIYGQPNIILPGCLLSLCVLFGAFQFPAWIYYRQMKFAKQRALLAIEPVVGFVVTMTMGALGFSYWSIVIGLLTGTGAAAIACVLASPYRLRWRFERAALREYYSFSWPLLVASGSSMLMVQAAVILGTHTVGLAGVGAIGLTSAWIAFADRADAVVTQTLYPAICAVKDRIDLLNESFTKSNRLALIWGMPFGLGLALFAPDLVHYVLGTKWNIAIGLLQVFGVATAVKQIAFNWTAYHRAVGETRPMAVNAVASLITFVALGVPGMILWGLTGYAIAMCSAIAVQLFCRAYFLARLFDGFSFLSHSLRAITPSIPAVGVVLLVRTAGSGERTLGIALGELALYLVTTLVATVLLERSLMREVVSYLRRPTAAATT